MRYFPGSVNAIYNIFLGYVAYTLRYFPGFQCGYVSYFPVFVVDIDECDKAEWPCAEEATCNNNEGSFSCACPKGYYGDGEYFCDGKRVAFLSPLISFSFKCHMLEFDLDSKVRTNSFSIIQRRHRKVLSSIASMVTLKDFIHGVNLIVNTIFYSIIKSTTVSAQ